MASHKFMTIEAWCNHALEDTDKVGDDGTPKPCTAIGCVHVTQNGSTQEVHTIPFVGKTVTAHYVAEKMRVLAEGDAQGKGGMQTYRLLAFYGGKEPQAFHTFKVFEGLLVTGESSELVEGPSERGIISLLLRHVESKDRTLMAFLHGTVGQWSEERTRLQSEVNDAYTVVREMMMREGDRQQEFRMAQLAYERTTKERSALLQMAPAIANGLLGKEVFPQAAADTALVDSLARKATPDQISMLVQMGLLPKELEATIIARFAQTHEKDREMKSELARMPAAHPNPEQEVQGN